MFSDRMVFVRAVHEKNKWLTDMELELYDSWWVDCAAGRGQICGQTTLSSCHEIRNADQGGQ